MLIYNIIGNEAQVVAFEELEKNVVIPSHYQGYPVTSIAEGAFAGAAIETVVLPKTLREIKARAFIGSLLRWIGCSSPIEDEESGISTIDASKIGTAAFLGTKLEDIVLIPQNGKLTIGESAFAKTNKLRNLLIPDGLREVNLGDSCQEENPIV